MLGGEIMIDNTAYKRVCIGLFGTCDKSTWRGKFIEEYDRLKIAYFDPMLENWDVDLPHDIEGKHMKEDAIILWAITNESYSSGSLAETGFSLVNATQLNNLRYLVVYIDETLDEKLKTNKEMYEYSLRQRQLVKARMSELKLDTLFLVNSLDEMLATSKVLYQICQLSQSIQHLNPHRQIKVI